MNFEGIYTLKVDGQGNLSEVNIEPKGVSWFHQLAVYARAEQLVETWPDEEFNVPAICEGELKIICDDKGRVILEPGANNSKVWALGAIEMAKVTVLTVMIINNIGQQARAAQEMMLAHQIAANRGPQAHRKHPHNGHQGLALP